MAFCVFLFGDLNRSDWEFRNGNNITTSAYSGGSGTESSPYLISNVSDLNALATAVNNGTPYTGEYFKQTANITLDSTWAGIGTLANYCTVAKGFEGHYDGNLQDIIMSGTVCGLFKATYTGATVTRVKISGSITFDNTNYICGGVVHVADSGSMTKYCYITQCKNNATMTFKPNGKDVGGIVGCAKRTFLDQVANEGNITTSDTSSVSLARVGGLMGYSMGAVAEYIVINDSYNAGSLVQGGVQSEKYDSHGAVAGIVARDYADYLIVNRCYNAGVLNGETTIQLIEGSGTKNNCFGVSTQTTTSSDTSLKTAEELKTQTTFTNWDFDTVWTFVEGENDGYPVLRAFYNNLTCSVDFDATTNGVTNSLGGSTTAMTVTVDEGGSFALNGQTATCSKSGWSFVGWSLTENSTDTITGISAVNEDTTLYAVYECTVALTFYQIYDDTATLISSKLYNNETNKTGTAPAITVPTGYTGVGWGTTKTSTTSTLSSSASVTLTETTNGQIYYAICKKNVTLTYDANDGTGRTFSDGGITYKTADGTTSGYTTKAEMKLKECSFTRDKYAFVKWQLLGVYRNVGLLVTTDKDCTAYAVWEKTVIDLTFNVNFGNYATAKANMILYLLCDDGKGGYTELSTFYFDGKQMTQESTAELSRGKEYKLLICKPYTWNLTVSGTGVSNATLVNCAYTFTTSGESGTITINTTGGTLINNYVII